MTRRRFIQQSNGDLVEVSLDYIPEPRNTDSVLWNDRAYQDMGDPRFKSRSEHREYMKTHDLTTVDDYRNQWREAEKRRVDLRHGRMVGQSKTDIRVALEKLQSGYKPRIIKE